MRDSSIRGLTSSETILTKYRCHNTPFSYDIRRTQIHTNTENWMDNAFVGSLYFLEMTDTLGDYAKSTYLSPLAVKSEQQVSSAFMTNDEICGNGGFHPAIVVVRKNFEELIREIYNIGLSVFNAYSSRFSLRLSLHSDFDQKVVDVTSGYRLVFLRKIEQYVIRRYLVSIQ